MSLANDFPYQGHLPYLIDQAHRRMQQDLAEIVNGDAFPGLRGSHFRILSMIPSEGARPSELAELGGMTRPALGEVVAHLQDQGYVSTAPDPSDGRAVIVTPTPLGTRAAAEANTGIAQLRRRWAREVGAGRLDEMLATLAALTVER